LSSVPPGATGESEGGPERSASPGTAQWLPGLSAEAVLQTHAGSPAARAGGLTDQAGGDVQPCGPDVQASGPGVQAAASDALPAPGLLNVANALTVLRLALVPVFVWFLLSGGAGDRAIAFVAFALASVTDLLDGELARRKGLITDFGKIADPIADKALTGSALITLSYLGELWWWVTAVIVVRELAVTALRFWVIRRGVIAASRGGKAKTMLQVIAISLYVLPWHLGLASQIVMGAALVVTVVTGADYTARAIRLHRAVQ
jgi:CDP-diacylglycerol--glycerol-3-phosphate 3-phosphatidyltransferase